MTVYIQYLSRYKKAEYEELLSRAKALSFSNTIWFNRFQTAQDESFTPSLSSLELIAECIDKDDINQPVLTMISALLLNPVGDSQPNYTELTRNRTIFNGFMVRLERYIPNDPNIITLMSSIPEFFEYCPNRFPLKPPPSFYRYSKRVF